MIPHSVLKPKDRMKLIVTLIVGVAFGFFIGISIPKNSPPKENKDDFFPSLDVYLEEEIRAHPNQTIVNAGSYKGEKVSREAQNATDLSKIWVESNPRGSERLPPGIVESESDLYPRRLYGDPREDLTIKQKYLVTFTVGYNQTKNIDAAVKKFSDDFTILLFHYDGRTTEWNEFEWSNQSIHVSVPKQTKWWYAKRFLHPDIVAPYDYIFIWDEDLGVENFDAERYIKLVKKHGLEISQPGLDPKTSKSSPWRMTKRTSGHEIHKQITEKKGVCSDPQLPPCAAFVEIMAPVFSREAWRCVWHLIQNDLVHGWGLDFALRKCVEPAHEKIGVVDSEWIVHQGLPSLWSQGEAVDGKPSGLAVRDRCRKEWGLFQARLWLADRAYYKSIGVEPSNIKSR